jgi:hypothetical protein
VFPDLFIVIRAHEKRMYDAIDGHRSVAEILETANESDPNVGRQFFEQLWRHDQVTFDTSTTKS